MVKFVMVTSKLKGHEKNYFKRLRSWIENQFHGKQLSFVQRQKSLKFKLAS